MDDYLEAALRPKPRLKRNAAATVGRTSGSHDSEAKRPRKRDERSEESTRTVPSRTEPEMSAGEASSAPISRAVAPQVESLPSFLETVAGQGSLNKPSHTRVLLDAAKQKTTENLLHDAHRLLMRALVMCACHAEVRKHTKDVGASLSTIDPIGRCSCRDFVAVAQTRRPQTKASIGINVSILGVQGNNASFPISELDLEAVYSLATDGRMCTCGSGRIRCSNPDHLAALGQLISVTSKLGRIDEAIVLGQWYVDLAPHHAQGYLHLAKAILARAVPKSKGKSQSESAKEACAAARFQARCIYRHGLHNATKHGNASYELVQILKRCCQEYSRDDHLPNLPLETVELIFKDLPFHDLLVCRSVSKRWQLVLQRARLCPPGILFSGPKPSLKKTKDFLQKMPGLQTKYLLVNYRGYLDAALTAQFITYLLRHFDSAETVELDMWEDSWYQQHQWRSPDNTDKAVKRFSLGPSPCLQLPAKTKCRRLILHNIRNFRDTPAQCLMAWASQSLETIELEGKFYSEPFDFQMPRLRHAKLSYMDWDSSDSCWPFMMQTFEAAGRLEQLYLDWMSFETRQDFDEALISQLERLFQNLHTLVIGEFCIFGPAARKQAGRNVRYAMFPRLPSSMRCIDIMTEDDYLTNNILFGHHYDARQAVLPNGNIQPLANLELFRCLCPVRFPQHLFQLIDPSLNGAEGRLAHLELSARFIPLGFTQNQEPTMHIAHPERLRTVGLYDFDWSSSGSANEAILLRGREFLDWVSQFRNAETICMYAAWRLGPFSDSETSARLLVALVEQLLRQAEADAKTDSSGDSQLGGGSISKHLKVRKIYQYCLEGTLKDHALKLVGDYPVEIPLDYFHRRPRIFPWPDCEG
ncbi:hypothetical protein SEPCBS119000_004721 [Sporothrix epigloea]|uniref:F-box domain-containing protein n=1 Tax=Sporothrix epigloea TaxID=1892477 RepID=A0ABP0DVL7_9PEZI